MDDSSDKARIMMLPYRPGSYLHADPLTKKLLVIIKHTAMMQLTALLKNKACKSALQESSD